MNSLGISVLLCLVSAACYGAAAIVQERVAATGEGNPLRRPGWWGAVGLTGVGAVLHVLALAYGPLSLVQPLGALTIVFALPMAAVFFRRPVGAVGWRGALLATGGLVALLALTGPPRTETLDGAVRPVLAAIGLGAVAVPAVAARWVRRPVVRGVVLASAAGAAFGLASVFTKAAAEDWSSHETHSLPTVLVAVVLFASTGLLLSQASYRGAGLAAPLATLTVINPAVAAAIGITVLGEGFRYGSVGGALAGLAGAVAASGVITLTARGGADPTGVGETGPTPAAGRVPAARTRGRCLVGARSRPFP
ncbi:DMT family transporter [Streptomyces sp. NPDC002537]